MVGERDKSIVSVLLNFPGLKICQLSERIRYHSDKPLINLGYWDEDLIGLHPELIRMKVLVPVH